MRLPRRCLGLEPCARDRPDHRDDRQLLLQPGSRPRSQDPPGLGAVVFQQRQERPGRHQCAGHLPAPWQADQRTRLIEPDHQVLWRPAGPLRCVPDRRWGLHRVRHPEGPVHRCLEARREEAVRHGQGPERRRRDRPDPGTEGPALAVLAATETAGGRPAATGPRPDSAAPSPFRCPTRTTTRTSRSRPTAFPGRSRSSRLSRRRPTSTR